MLYWLLAIPLVGIMVLVHEIGHFLVARRMGVRIVEFGLGLPPRLLTLGVWKGVRYTLNLLPLGGFVRLAGEDDPTVQDGLAGKRPGRRAMVLLAGAAMNLVLAFFLFFTAALLPYEEVVFRRVGVLGIIPGGPAEQAGLRSGDAILAVGGRPVQDEGLLLELLLNGGQPTPLLVQRGSTLLTLTVVPSVEPLHHDDRLGILRYTYDYPEAVLTEVLAGRPAYQAGLRSGDVVVGLDGETITTTLDFWSTLERRRREGGPLVFTVRRAGQLLEPITVYPPSPEEKDQSLGLCWNPPKEERRRSFPEALAQGIRETWEAILLVPRVLAAMVRGSVPLQEISGPLGMTQAAAEVVRTGQADRMLRLVGILSANLFVVNLLPLPALDGGRLAFVLVEWLRGGRRVPPRREALVHLIGMLLLLGLVLLVSYFDLLRLR